MKRLDTNLSKCASCGAEGVFGSRWKYEGDKPAVRLSLFAQCNRGGPSCYIAQAEDEHKVTKKWNAEQRKQRKRVEG